VTLPLPLESADELALGHVGRLGKWCGAKSRNEVFEALRERIGIRGTGVTPALHAVAIACGIQPDQYVGRHSMLPFTCFLVSANLTLGRCAPRWSDPVVSKIGCLTPLGLPTFCARCALEQRDRFAYSTWVRTFQLPGTLRCSQHESPLLQAPDAESFMKQPSDVYASGRYLTLPARKWSYDHPAIVKFAACAREMLATSRSWPGDLVRRRLSQRAELVGLRTSRVGSSPLLSDQAFDTFPIGFLEEFFPVPTQRTGGLFVPAIDCASIRTSNAPTGVAIALAMSLLYSSPREALNALTLASQLDP